MCSETAANTAAGTRIQNTSGIIQSRNTHAEIGRLSIMGKFILAIAIFIVAVALGVSIGGNDNKKR